MKLSGLIESKKTLRSDNMHKVEFPYELDDKRNVRVIAECKAINGDECTGLTLKFLDYHDELIEVKYNKDMFDDIEDIATGCLVDNYYNQDAYSYMH